MQPACLALVAPSVRVPSVGDDPIQRVLSGLIGPQQYERWFRERIGLSLAGGNLVVSAASPFLATWIQKQFKAPLSQAAADLLGPAARVLFESGYAAGESATTPSAEQAALIPPQAAETESVTTLTVKPTAVPVAASDRAGGRRLADLHDFVPGPCNELALTAVRQVCARPNGAGGPLFLYGPAGTGKTHLLEGIHRRLRQSGGETHSVLLTSEQFTNYFTQAYRERTLPAFRLRFRNVDALLVDDVDFLDGKRGVQEEFLHTVQQLESFGKLIVVTADRHPRLLTKISDELRTRFQSGMICRLELPDRETRERIVALKAARLDGQFSPEALRYVAQRFNGSVRELEGALQCLQVYHRMTGKRIGVTAARQALSDLERDCLRVVRLADIDRAVCDLFGLDADVLRSPSRTRAASEPRMLAMYLARRHTRSAYSEIGRHFGGRNHATVIAAERKVAEWLRQGTPLRVASRTCPLGDILETIEQQLQAG